MLEIVAKNCKVWHLPYWRDAKESFLGLVQPHIEPPLIRVGPLASAHLVFLDLPDEDEDCRERLMLGKICGGEHAVKW